MRAHAAQNEDYLNIYINNINMYMTKFNIIYCILY